MNPFESDISAIVFNTTELMAREIDSFGEEFYVNGVFDVSSYMHKNQNNVEANENQSSKKLEIQGENKSLSQKLLKKLPDQKKNSHENFQITNHQGQHQTQRINSKNQKNHKEIKNSSPKKQPIIQKKVQNIHQTEKKNNPGILKKPQKKENLVKQEQQQEETTTILEKQLQKKLQQKVGMSSKQKNNPLSKVKKQALEQNVHYGQPCKKRILQELNLKKQTIIVPKAQSYKNLTRYSKRPKFKPLRYWQNQKIQYRHGRAVGINNLLLGMGQILKLKNAQKWENHLYAKMTDIYEQTIEIAFKKPFLERFEFRGYSQPYKFLQINPKIKLWSNRINRQNLKKLYSQIQVLFDDGLNIHKLKIIQANSQESLNEQWIQVQPAAPFSFSSSYQKFCNSKDKKLFNLFVIITGRIYKTKPYEVVSLSSAN